MFDSHRVLPVVTALGVWGCRVSGFRVEDFKVGSRT